MAIIGALPPESEAALVGIVEAGQAHQCESRKGSREWVRHKRDPASHAAPPRLRWQDYKRRGASLTAPPGSWRAWEKKLLAATERSGHRAFEAIADAGQAAISGALLPVMAPGAVLARTVMRPTNGSRKTNASGTSHSTRDGDRNAPRAAITSIP
jgi:hypothetical protein